MTAAAREQILAAFCQETIGRGRGYWWRPRGYSMQPAIGDGERVLIRPVDPAALRVGQIVKFRMGGDFRLHRLVRKTRDERGEWSFEFKGDGLDAADPPVRASEVVGLAVAVERRGRLHRLDTSLASSPAGAVHHAVELCRAYLTGDDPPWPVPADRDDLLAVGRRHRVTPLFATLLDEPRAIGDPTGLAEALRHDRYAGAARQVALGRIAHELIGALGARNVPVTALKGLDLAHHYHRDPAARPMQDVDLLVRRADVPAVLSTAREVGLERVDDRQSLAFDLRFGTAVVLSRRPGDVTAPSVDVHWRLVDDARLGDVALAWSDEVWTRAQPAAIGGLRVATLAPTDLVVHLALHLALHHAFDGLLWYVDLALALRRLRDPGDWEAVFALARRLRLESALRLALALTADLLGVPLPASVRERLAPRALRHRLAVRLVRPRVVRLEPTRHLEHVLPLLLADDVRTTLDWARLAVVPSPAWMRLRYAGTPWPLAYARHGLEGVRLLGRALQSPRARG